MRIFGRTGGYYLFWASAIYLATGLTLAVYYKIVPAEYLQIIWVLVLVLPFLIPPIGRYFNIDVDWDQKMFDWMKKNKTPTNVVPFPAPQAVEPVAPSAPKKPDPKTYYTFGLTDDNRVSFTMGYTTLTMNREGTQQLIDQLKFFQSQLHEDLE